MVAMPITPAAPVTTAILPSRRIRSGIGGAPPAVRFFEALRALGVGLFDPRLTRLFHLARGLKRCGRTATETGKSGLCWPKEAVNRPFPAVFGVLTGSLRASVAYTMSQVRFACQSREMLRTFFLTGFAALVAAATISFAPPARAQIGNIFSDQPRPPGNVPRGNQQQPVPDDEEEVPELPRGRLLPTPNRPLPGQGVPPPGSVQSQPLAPPPGTTVIPQNTPPGVAVAPPQPN